MDPNDGLVALPDLPLDPSAAAEAGLGTEFEDLLDEGQARLSQRFRTQPVTRSAWPTTVALTTDGATLLRDAGIPMLVVPFDRYLGYQGSLADLTDTSLLSSARLPDEAAIRMIVVDPITELLEPGLRPGSSPAEAAVRLIASTSAMRYQLNPDLRSMLLTTADLTAPDPAVLAHLEQFVAEHPDYSFQPLDRIADITNQFFVEGNQVTVDLDVRGPVSIEQRAQRINATRLRIADVTSMLPDSDLRPLEWQATVRTALSTGLTDVAGKPADRSDRGRPRADPPGGRAARGVLLHDHRAKRRYSRPDRKPQ